MYPRHSAWDPWWVAPQLHRIKDRLPIHPRARHVLHPRFKRLLPSRRLLWDWDSLGSALSLRGPQEAHKAFGHNEPLQPLLQSPR